MEQHMADPEYRAESKPDAAKEIAEHREAAQYYKRKARSFSETDPSYSTYMKKAEEYENKAKELEGSKLESDFDDEGDSTGTNWQEKVEQNPRDGYNFEKMNQHRIPTSQTDKEELNSSSSDI